MHANPPMPLLRLVTVLTFVKLVKSSRIGRRPNMLQKICTRRSSSTYSNRVAVNNSVSTACTRKVNKQAQSDL